MKFWSAKENQFEYKSNYVEQDKVITNIFLWGNYFYFGYMGIRIWTFGLTHLNLNARQ